MGREEILRTAIMEVGSNARRSNNSDSILVPILAETGAGNV